MFAGVAMSGYYASHVDNPQKKYPKAMFLATLLILAMVLIPNINTAYWILTSFTTTLLTLYYLPVFAAVIKLRYTQPDTPRPFRFWGGMTGDWIISGVGFLATAFSGFMAFNRPEGITIFTKTEYLLVMVVGTFIWMVPYLLFRWFRRPGWKTDNSKD